ncbi:hypothetical protein EPN83_00110 [Patescibacteria group bacterium]|nr:MAG: hypothetical protein EPN83_00110 [Patescibacteria group bacterium]
MDSEDKRILGRTLELAEENNKMLKKLIRGARWARIVRFIYILIIVGSAVGIFYYIQPYLNQLVETYGSFKEGINSLGGVLR